LDAALLITLTAGTVANLITGTDHTIGARDAAAVGSTRNDTFGRVPVSAASSKQDKARALARLMSQSAELGSPASVRVIKNPGPPPTYTVIVPGTEDWIPGGDTVTDIESNTQLRLDLKSSAEAAVKAAMAEAGVPTGAHVMLVGHSQGGMTSVSLARDPQFSQQYHVDQVVAFGSPVDDKPVPSQTQVLSIANGGDLVPGLDGLPGTLGLPSSNVTRVNFFDPQLDINPFAAIGAAHDPRRYAQHVEEMSGNSQLIRSIDAAMRFMPAENSTATDVQVRAR
jgi:pimeloyl-ACP methyl ester carboxylesterase